MRAPRAGAARARRRAAVVTRGGCRRAAGVSNPIDLAGGAEQDVSTFGRVAAELLSSSELDALYVTGYFGGYEEYGEAGRAEEVATAERIAEVAVETGRPVVVHTLYPNGSAAVALRAHGVPVYETVERGASALARLVDEPARVGDPFRRCRRRAPVSADPDNYQRARELLADGGVPFVAVRTIDATAGADAVVAAADELGYPVDTEGARPAAQVRCRRRRARARRRGRAARRPLDIAARLAPAAFSIERMAPVADGAELLIGARWDPRLGPIALVGAGGLYAELLRDTAVALAPLDLDGARRLIESLRVAPLLHGARGRPPLDLDAAAGALAALVAVAAAHPELAELEVNPLLVLPDARSRSTLASSTSHPTRRRAVEFTYSPEQVELRDRAQSLTDAIIPFEIPCEEAAACRPSRWRRSAGWRSTTASTPSTCRPSGAARGCRSSSR